MYSERKADQKLYFTLLSYYMILVAEAIRSDDWFILPALPVIFQWRTLYVVPTFNNGKTSGANYSQYSLYTEVYICWSSKVVRYHA